MPGMLEFTSEMDRLHIMPVGFELIHLIHGLQVLDGLAGDIMQITPEPDENG